MIRGMGSIEHVAHKAIEDIWDGVVEITEKIDGSFFSFGLVDGELCMRSKGQELFEDAPSAKMFKAGMDAVKEREGLLQPDWIYRGEYLSKPKHNSLCLAPDTLVLTQDLRWIPIGDVSIGDTLVGFDEELPRAKTQRKLYPSIIQDHWESKASDCYRIILSDGREVVATADHKWLAQTIGNPPHHKWITTKELVSGVKIRNLFEPWEEKRSYEAGYLAAAFDGEGSLCSGSSNGGTSTDLTFVQRENEMLDRTMDYLTQLGFQYNGPYLKSDHSAKTLGIYSMAEAVKFLGVVRPVRLNNWNRIWAGRSLPRSGFATVVASEAIRQSLDVVDLTTTTRTFIANGLATHNCYDRIPEGHVVLFDIEISMGEHADRDLRLLEASRLGFDPVPVLYEGIWSDGVEGLKAFLSIVSCLGGQKIEGVVVKNYGQTHNGHVMMGKLVSDEFKEVHRKSWKQDNPSRGDVVEQLIASYKTEARWRKAVQHLEERGELTNSPRDIGALLKEVSLDVLKEEEQEIKDALFKLCWPKISRGIGAGLPQFYKRLLEEGDVPKVELD